MPTPTGSGRFSTHSPPNSRPSLDGPGPIPETPVMLFIPNLHRHRKLRTRRTFPSLDAEADAKPSESLQEIILEGPPWGFHLVTSLDSYNNVTRTLGRKAAASSRRRSSPDVRRRLRQLIDSGKASELGMNRALLYDEAAGTIEIFRPYAMPGDSCRWLGFRANPR